MEEIVRQHCYQPERFDSSTGMFINVVSVPIGSQFVKCFVFDIPSAVPNSYECFSWDNLFGQCGNPHPLREAVFFFASPLPADCCGLYGTHNANFLSKGCP